MLHFFRRPPRDDFELDSEASSGTAGDNEPGTDADRDRVTGRTRRVRNVVLASGILAVALSALYLGWSGSRSGDHLPPRLLPEGRPSLTENPPSLHDAMTPPVANAPAPLPSAAPAAPSAPDASPAEQAQAPTVYMPLQGDSREVASSAPAPETRVPSDGPYNVLAEVSHEATVENLRAQIAELKLRRLKAELEGRELSRNPKRLFPEAKAPVEPKKEPSPLTRSSPALTTAGREPLPAQLLPEQPITPAAPPLMRVRMVTLEPKEALIEAGDGDSHGWFKVLEGQKFPDFTVTAIGEDGVTISFAGRQFFYPVGGWALGAPQDNRAASRQASESPLR